VGGDEEPGDAAGERAHGVEVRLAVQGGDDVQPARSRRHQLRRQLHLLQQPAHTRRRPPHVLEVRVAAGVEVEDEEVGIVRAVRLRQPAVRGDARLPREIDQRGGVVAHRVAHRAALLGEFGGVHPVREVVGGVLLHQRLAADAVRVALHHQRTSPQPRYGTGGDPTVVVGEFALGDPVVGEEHLLGPADLDVLHTAAS
jgi:hypothetical protein